MRLLHILSGDAPSSPTSEISFTMVEFPGDIKPPYAILSHTWEDEEATFLDVQKIETAQKKKGYAKIVGVCRLALKDGFEYLWVDSCCINKESSAELSEALNSMYQYYGYSSICYVYLSDVQHDEDSRAGNSTFRRCKWFTRGWTLQELIAPAKVVFYDMDWVEIGTKFTLHDVITAITRIPTQVLFERDTRSISIAKRMSWAAFRETTRPEDRAYSLMGLFGVNMPPIYGEGLAGAFIRLQREIISFSNDRSIFAWTADPDDIDLNNRGLLAKSPSEFRCSGNVGVQNLIGVDPSFSLTNSGMMIHLPLEQCGTTLTKAFLHCHDEKSSKNLAIYLRHGYSYRYTRCNADELLLEPGPLPLDHVQKVYISEDSRAGEDWGSGTGVALRPYPPIPLRVVWDLQGPWSAEYYNYHLDWRGDTFSINHQYSFDPSKTEGGDGKGWQRGEQQMFLPHDDSELVLTFGTNDHDADGQGGERKFAVALRIVRKVSSIFFMEILTGQDVPSQNESSPEPCLPTLLKYPHLSTYRATVNLQSGDMVSSVLYRLNEDKATSWVLEVRATPSRPGWHVPALELLPPESGFLVHKDISMSPFSNRDVVFRLQKVLPPDFFQEDHGPRRDYISIVNGDPRILVYELRFTSFKEMHIRSPIQFVMALGIQDDKAWSQMISLGHEARVAGTPDPTVESILSQSAHTRRWEGEQSFMMRLPSWLRLHPKDEFTLGLEFSVTAGRKDDSRLQPGSHYIHITIIVLEPSR